MTVVASTRTTMPTQSLAACADRKSRIRPALADRALNPPTRWVSNEFCQSIFLLVAWTSRYTHMS